MHKSIALCSAVRCNFVHFIFQLKYRQPYQGKGPKIREVKDVPSVLHSKKMQDLLSDKRYKSNYEEIKDRYHLDIATPAFITAKRASQLLSDVRKNS